MAGEVESAGVQTSSAASSATGPAAVDRRLVLDTTQAQIIDWIPAVIDERKALLYLRVPTHAEQNPFIDQHLADLRVAQATAARLVQPRAIYRVVPIVGRDAERVLLADGCSFRGPGIARLLVGAERVIVVIATLGPAVDAEVDRLFAAKAYVEWYTLNALGAALTNEYAHHVAVALRRAAARAGWQTTAPLGPGFKYWALEDQRVIFDLLPATQIGVVLDEAWIMVPHKTKSMVIGIGHALARRGAAP